MPGGHSHFVGLNTEDRIGMLRRAWVLAPAGGNTLLPQLNILACQAAEVEGEDLQSAASNSHTAMTQLPGTATAPAAEKTRAWYQIIEGFQTTRQFLMDCCAYGLDAFQVKHQGYFPNPLPAAVQNPVLLDSFGKWLRLCNKYGDDFVSAAIIGKAVDDGAIYLWLLHNPQLLSITQGITEQRGEYTEAIIGRVGGVIFS